MGYLRKTWIILLAMGVAACGSKGPAPEGPEKSEVTVTDRKSAPEQPKKSPDTNGHGVASDAQKKVPPPEPTKVEPEVKPTPPPPVAPVRDVALAKTKAYEGLYLLSDGKWAQGQKVLEEALRYDPDNSMAKVLLTQLNEDPAVVFSPECHKPHRVKKNEWLTTIAKNKMGSELYFVILAKYNRIDVPGAISPNQEIKIPCKKYRE